ncbi:MAG: pyridoxal phosphate-dependent aminotransferase [Clostridiales bacterium]|uniref:pyridoxal phosphate-dependent aminotransferase n=1 Tax=Clostridium sp. N3C TaxID=1776758 RepID=UPI00092E029E|nr:pyridoxal phosphate-dependent aminotransferase [Clostridium sp. N3C]NLZ48258.1 pyridoxal phosphate-dependent aminotransferase [Clostridiales bacterium]SCN25894.1 Aspartate aminotransferase [Clostridium sp. N3C]
MFSEKVVENLKKSSWIRVMFEEGNRLAKIYGADKVYDYSLGNPFGEPPVEVNESLKKHILSGEEGLHKYMSNAGYPEVRRKIAKSLQQESGISLNEENIVMTVGAAGGLNVVLKALLNEGEEVIVFAPYFVEYNCYIDNNGGKTIVVPADTKSFQPNLNEFKKLISPKTKAVIINSPNNPTGVVYSEESLKSMSLIIEEKEKEYGTTIFLISDEPYNKIVYDGLKLTPIMSVFKNAIIVNSFSKSLGLAGERIGYIAISSCIDNADLLANALIYCNRTLGFVNAPALFQKVAADALDAKIDIEDYQEKRDFLYSNLTRLGFECIKPQGAFYLFPKALIEDEVEFVNRALKYNLLLVPGSGFGCPGYFRMSYCVKFDMIKNSISAFEELVKEFK